MCMKKRILMCMCVGENRLGVVVTKEMNKIKKIIRIVKCTYICV